MQILYCAAASLLMCTASIVHAQGEPHHVLKFATVAPDGTAWARELKAFGRDVEMGTHGAVTVKFYYGGIAGAESELQGRIERGQLDGVASGGMMCQTLAPSMRVMRVRGVFSTRDEAAYVINRLKPIFDEEFQKSGYVHLASTGLGPDVVFSRTPIRTMQELRSTRFWRWNLDDVALAIDRELGLDVVPLPLEEAGAAYDEGRVDGFLALPTAAVAFQWFTRTRYLLDLRGGFLWGCMIASQRSFYRLNAENQRVVMAAAAKLVARFEAVGRQQDDALLGGLFERQGVKKVPVTPELRSQFLAAARQARERLGAKILPPELLQKVLALLADYRAEHPEAK